MGIIYDTAFHIDMKSEKSKSAFFLQHHLNRNICFHISTLPASAEAKARPISNETTHWDPLRGNRPQVQAQCVTQLRTSNSWIRRWSRNVTSAKACKESNMVNQNPMKGSVSISNFYSKVSAACCPYYYIPSPKKTSSPSQYQHAENPPLSPKPSQQYSRCSDPLSAPS